MWLVGVRDLQYRRRRFLIAIFATAVVFSMTILMSGVSHGLDVEAESIVDSFDASSWVVARGASGPFTASKFLSSTTDVARVAALPGVREAAPVVVARATVGSTSLTDVNLIGFVPGGLGAPQIEEGKPATRAGEVVVDSKLGVDVGDRILVSGRPERVVGKTGNLRFNFGVNTVFLTMKDAQSLVFSGQTLASGVITRGFPRSAPPGLRVMTNEQVVSDIGRTLKSGKQTIDIVKYMLWAVAAGIVASMVYLTALERVRDFAVLKATGTSNGVLLGALTFQAVGMSLGAAVVAVVIALLLAPLFPFQLAITGSAYVLLGILAVVVGLLASLAGLRRAVSVDPASAFGGA